MPVQNFESQKKEKKEWTPVKAGLYQAQISDITDIKKRPFGSGPEAEATEDYKSFHFVILTEGEFKGRSIVKDVRPVTPFPPTGTAKASWLWKIVSAVSGHDFTAQEASVFNKDTLNSLIGQQLQIMVNQTKKEGRDGKTRIYNNITDVLAAENYIEPLLADGESQITNDDLPF